MHVTTHGLIKEYGNRRALDGVSLQIEGGMFGLLGPNGAGKTTLMRLLTTSLAPTAGSIRLGNIDVVKEPDRARGYIGYLPQEFGFYKSLTAYEMLDYVALMKNIPHPERRRKVEQVLEQVNLTPDARRRVGGYSGGMKQRLGIAQALLGDPALLVVDEPTAGLDPEERIRFRNLLARLAGERTVLLSTHIVGDVEANCTALAVLRQGRLAFQGAPQELMEAARGKVWLLEVNQEQWSDLEQHLRVISTRQVGRQVQLRVLADENPMGLGSPAEPGLEDGYLAIMGGSHG